MLLRSLLLLAAATAAPQQPQQFDLVCSGQMRFDLAGPYQQHDFRLHVDLAARQWCEGDCKAVRPLADVQPATIWFEKSSDDDQALGINHDQVVNRQTGEFMLYHHGGHAGVVDVKASCAPAPYTAPAAVSRKF